MRCGHKNALVMLPRMDGKRTNVVIGWSYGSLTPLGQLCLQLSGVCIDGNLFDALVRSNLRTNGQFKPPDVSMTTVRI